VTGRLARAAPYALLLVLAGVCYHFALRIDASAAAGRLGPDFWPRAVLVLLALVCIYELAKSFLAAGLGGKPTNQAPAAKASALRVGAGIAATVAYVVLVDVLGFFIATAAFIAAFIAIGGYRRWGVVAACAAGGSLALVVVFMKVVYVSLPLGAGPFRALSVALLALLGVR
jgi:putative tricarboxylic transport membrane protein